MSRGLSKRLSRIVSVSKSISKQEEPFKSEEGTIRLEQVLITDKEELVT